MILDDWMYYLRWESGAMHLCRMNLDDLDEQIVVENWDQENKNEMQQLRL